MKNYTIKWKSNRPIYIKGLIDEQVKLGCKDPLGDITKPTKYSNLGWLTWKLAIPNALFCQDEVDSAMKDYHQALSDLKLKPEEFKEKFPIVHRILWRAHYAIKEEEKEAPQSQKIK